MNPSLLRCNDEMAVPYDKPSIIIIIIIRQWNIILFVQLSMCVHESWVLVCLCMCPGPHHERVVACLAYGSQAGICFMVVRIHLPPVQHAQRPQRLQRAGLVGGQSTGKDGGAHVIPCGETTHIHTPTFPRPVWLLLWERRQLPVYIFLLSLSVFLKTQIREKINMYTVLRNCSDAFFIIIVIIIRRSGINPIPRTVKDRD